MSTGKVLLAVQGEIFQQGLNINFRDWGFDPIILKSNKPAEWQQAIRTQHPILLLVADYPRSKKITSLVEEQATLPIIFLFAKGPLPENTSDSPHQFLSKPCSISQLKETVSQLLFISLPKNEPDRE